MNDFIPNTPFIFPFIFDTIDAQNNFLDSLDSDTREYVKNHAGDYSSLDELQKSLENLRGTEG